MKELLNKLLKFIVAKKSIANIDYYIVYYNGLPILLSKSDLSSSINRSFITSRDRRYFGLPVELKSKEMLRAEAKLSAQETKNTGEL